MTGDTDITGEITGDMTRDEAGLTATEAAARLGVKRQTLYAYVSRGILGREVSTDGRTSRYDPAEVERVRQGRRPDADGELHTLIATQLTSIDDHQLLIRGRDLIAIVSDGMSFTDVVDILWSTPDSESWRDPATFTPDPIVGQIAGPVVSDAHGSLLDLLRIITARRSANDPLRHDLSPKSVRSAGRSLITALATELAPLNTASKPGDDTVASALWRRLAAEPATARRLRALDSALALLVDHGLAGSTFAARIAASVRADPYSVVGAGLGVLGGPLHGAASAGVHELLLDSERSADATGAAGAVRRRLGRFPGFGHMVYQTQDPRYGALMALLVDAWGDDARLVNVYRVRDVIAERTDAIPNVDLALGALTYLARMPTDAGEMIFAISRTAGWLAHAMEEYEEKPLRFRTKAKYAGPHP